MFLSMIFKHNFSSECVRVTATNGVPPPPKGGHLSVPPLIMHQSIQATYIKYILGFFKMKLYLVNGNVHTGYECEKTIVTRLFYQIEHPFFMHTTSAIVTSLF